MRIRESAQQIATGDDDETLAIANDYVTCAVVDVVTHDMLPARTRVLERNETVLLSICIDRFAGP